MLYICPCKNLHRDPIAVIGHSSAFNNEKKNYTANMPSLPLKHFKK